MKEIDIDQETFADEVVRKTAPKVINTRNVMSLDVCQEARQKSFYDRVVGESEF